ncbi:unnamed protein product, partial [Rotaria sordida]
SYLQIWERRDVSQLFTKT